MLQITIYRDLRDSAESRMLPLHVANMVFIPSIPSGLLPGIIPENSWVWLKF